MYLCTDCPVLDITLLGTSVPFLSLSHIKTFGMNLTMSENGCNVFTVMYKYAMLMCNCRRTFEPLQSSPANKLETETISNGSLTDMKTDYTELDKLLNGSDRDKQKAYNTLKQRASVSVGQPKKEALIIWKFNPKAQIKYADF